MLPDETVSNGAELFLPAIQAVRPTMGLLHLPDLLIHLT